MQVQALASSLAQTHPLNALVSAPRRCYAGESWEWDGVRFAFLHPRPGESPVRRNNQSCVLRVAASGAAMLLTGDIERSAEVQLLDKDLKADVVLAPHHGSRSSSSREFIEAVAPRWAVVAAGYRNRFGHPNAEVLDRYRSAGVSVMRTDLSGAIHVVLSSRGPVVEAERSRRPRYWRAVPPV